MRWMMKTFKPLHNVHELGNSIRSDRPETHQQIHLVLEARYEGLQQVSLDELHVCHLHCKVVPRPL